MGHAPRLAEAERQSLAWKIVEAQAQREIDAALAEIVTPRLATERTEYLRGRIAALKGILSLAQSDPRDEIRSAGPVIPY
jgi:hypothetical protein